MLVPYLLFIDFAVQPSEYLLRSVEPVPDSAHAVFAVVVTVHVIQYVANLTKVIYFDGWRRRETVHNISQRLIASGCST